MTKTKKTSVVLLGVVIMLSLAVLLWRSPESSSFETKEAVPKNKDFAQAQHLEGKWVRTDGGYRLVIEDIKPDGSLKASYYNPRKINVHESNWKVQEGSVHLFVELRDINYPGSTYTLLYVKKQDVLTGAYFQAVHKQTFEIKFTRIVENSKE